MQKQFGQLTYRNLIVTLNKFHLRLSVNYNPTACGCICPVAIGLQIKHLHNLRSHCIKWN